MQRLSRHVQKPRESHWRAGKHVLRYLCGTCTHGIVYTRSTAQQGSTALPHAVGYCDADHAGDADTGRSTTGFVHIMNGGAVSWQSRLQPTTARSTAEAEHTSASAVTQEALWLRKLQHDLSMRGCIMPLLATAGTAESPTA